MSVREVVARDADRYVTWLTEACSFPSMATNPEGLAAMAQWVEDKLAEVGATTQRLALDGAPDALLGRIGGGPRTILVYDHYDVQPVDPIGLWQSPPFEPQVRNGVFYARGAADNKGDLVARLAGLDAYRQVHGDPPVTIKVLVEGEEETGSRSFEDLIARYGNRLAADGCIWEGLGIDHAGRPSFVFGAKGLCYLELTLRLLNEDQHSSVAVIAPNAGWRLIEALTTLRASDGRVLVDGFYDDVVGPSDEDVELLENYAFDENAELERLGIPEFVGGDRGMDLKRRYFFEPTCNLAGFVTGFTVPGTSKTVLPKEALAKVDLRLVPDQDPNDIATKVRKHLDARGFDDIEIKTYSMEHPVRSPADSDIGLASLKAAADVFDLEPSIAPMMIGTGPMYPIAHRLGIPTVSPAGVCRPDSNIHAPNENCRIDDFLKIVEYTAAWIDAFASQE